jgi:hypothetical protein
MDKNDHSDEEWQKDSENEAEEDESTMCLFSDHVFPTAAAALQRDALHFGFDLTQYVREVS